MGGLPVLYPILEQLALVTPDQQASDPTAGSDFITPDVTTPADGDWVILPSNRASGLFLPQPAKQHFFISWFLFTVTCIVKLGHTCKQMYFYFLFQRLA